MMNPASWGKSRLMVKRNPKNPGSLRQIWPIFKWRTCDACCFEFRREWLWCAVDSDDHVNSYCMACRSKKDVPTEKYNYKGRMIVL